MLFCFVFVFLNEQARSDTLYCFDFLELLEAGVEEQWAAYAKDRPQVFRYQTRHWIHPLPAPFSEAHMTTSP